MQGDYYGLPTVVLRGAYLRVECLAEAGPRIVRLSVAGSSENLLAELPGVHWSTQYGDYYPRGGHRLWHAPEAYPRTYIPDNDGVSLELRPGSAPGAGSGETAVGACLEGPIEGPTGIRKRLELCLLPGRPALQVTHLLQNHGLWPVDLAPWAITQLPLGGAAILPQVAPPAPKAALLPDRSLVLWPYTRWRDARLCVSDDYVVVLAHPGRRPCKIGCLVHEGWVAYLNGDALFVKRFQPQPGRPHADLGCNAEVYCGDRFIELETLGPLVRLEPGEEVAHVETWEVYTLPDVPADLAGGVEACRALGLPSADLATTAEPPSP